MITGFTHRDFVERITLPFQLGADAFGLRCGCNFLGKVDSGDRLMEDVESFPGIIRGLELAERHRSDNIQEN